MSGCCCFAVALTSPITAHHGGAHITMKMLVLVLVVAATLASANAAVASGYSQLKKKKTLPLANSSSKAPRPPPGKSTTNTWPARPHVPDSVETIDNRFFVMFHEGARTCWLPGADASSLGLHAEGPFVSLGRPVPEMRGVQVFASTAYREDLLPALMVHIPAAANPLGNFDRWAVFQSLARRTAMLGKAKHEQALETTAESNGTEWRFVVDLRLLHGNRQAALGRDAVPLPYRHITLPLGPPICAPGHDSTVDVMGAYCVAFHCGAHGGPLAVVLPANAACIQILGRRRVCVCRSNHSLPRAPVRWQRIGRASVRWTMSTSLWWARAKGTRSVAASRAGLALFAVHRDIKKTPPLPVRALVCRRIFCCSDCHRSCTCSTSHLLRCRRRHATHPRSSLILTASACLSGGFIFSGNPPAQRALRRASESSSYRSSKFRGAWTPLACVGSGWRCMTHRYRFASFELALLSHFLSLPPSVSVSVAILSLSQCTHQLPCVMCTRSEGGVVTGRAPA